MTFSSSPATRRRRPLQPQSAIAPVPHVMRAPAFALSLAVLTACSAPPQEVTLAQLAGQQDAYDGRVVITVGVLRSHPAPRHFWIADAADHRVELRRAEDLSALVGKQLSVQGRFRYAANRGRYIDVHSLAESP